MLTPITNDDLYVLLAEQLLPQITAALDAAGPGQRLRVTTLPVPVMERLCGALQPRQTSRAYVLAKDPSGATWRASSTKLIELRNVLKEPLLVFIPPDLRTAAEDSLDIATFTELALRNVTDDVRGALLERIAEPLRARVAAALKYVQTERILQNSDEAVDYLLTVVRNGATIEAAGAALYCFGLVPDLSAFKETAIERRLSRNAVKVHADPEALTRARHPTEAALRLSARTQGVVPPVGAGDRACARVERPLVRSMALPGRGRFVDRRPSDPGRARSAAPDTRPGGWRGPASGTGPRELEGSTQDRVPVAAPSV
jgi:hypothetical protein